jgi:hypothetical protein
MGRLRRLFDAAARPRRVMSVNSPSDAVPRTNASLAQLRGWRRSGNRYSGPFATSNGTCPGVIELAGDTFRVLIHRPPESLTAHPKWICFSPQGGDWFRIHLAVNPADRDINSIIYYVEQLLTESRKLGGRR